MAQFHRTQFSSVRIPHQTPRRITISPSWFHHPGIPAILTSSYMCWPTEVCPQGPRCVRKMEGGVPDGSKRFTVSKWLTKLFWPSSTKQVFFACSLPSPALQECQRFQPKPSHPPPPDKLPTNHIFLLKKNALLHGKLLE